MKKPLKNQSEAEFFCRELFPFIQKHQLDVVLPKTIHKQVPHLEYNDDRVELLIYPESFSLFCAKYNLSVDIKYSEITKKKVRDFFSDLEQEQIECFNRKNKINVIIKHLNKEGHRFVYKKNFDNTTNVTLICNGLIFIELHYSLKRIKQIYFQSMTKEKDLRGMTMTMIKSLKAVEELIELIDSFENKKEEVRNEIEN